MHRYQSVRIAHISAKVKTPHQSEINLDNHLERSINSHVSLKTNRIHRSHTQSQVNPSADSQKYINVRPLSAVSLATMPSAVFHTKSSAMYTIPMMTNHNKSNDVSYITDIANPLHRKSHRKRIKCRRTWIIALIICSGLFLLGILIPVSIFLSVKQSEIQQSTTTTSVTSTTTTMFNTGWNSTAVTIAGITNSPGIGAHQLNAPIGLALDLSKTLYIADRDNSRVQKWLMGASNGTTIAGLANGTSGSTVDYLRTPRDVELDSSGNVYIADAANHRVVLWPIGASSCIVVAGNGTSGSANNQLNIPYGIAHNWNTGTLYIADTYNHRIMSYASGASTGIMVIGGPGTSNTQLSTPTGLYFDTSSNSLYIANTNANNIVRWVVGASSWILVAGSISGSSGITSTLLNYPRDVVLDSMSNIYVADAFNHRIQFFLAGQSNGTTIAGVAGTSGSTSILLNTPISLVVDSQFNVYVADLSNNRVQRFDHY